MSRIMNRLRREKLRKTVLQLEAAAGSAPMGAAYATRRDIRMRDGDIEVMRDLSTRFVVLGITDQDEVPAIVVLGTNVTTAWSCLCTGVRGLIHGGLVDTTPELIAILQDQREALQEEYACTLRDPAPYVQQPMTRTEKQACTTTLRQKGLAVPPDIQARLDGPTGTLEDAT